MLEIANIHVRYLEDELVEATMERIQQTASHAGAHMQQMPLTFLKAGEVAQVLKVRGSGETHHHLENLGFVPNAQIKVITEQNGGVIVEVKGAQVALDRSAAAKIITC